MHSATAQWAPSSPARGAERRAVVRSLKAVEQPGHLARLGVDALWNRAKGAGIRVGLLDSGVADVPGLLGPDTAYLDHQGVKIGPGDRGGHGTACASLIASRDPRALGVAPEATIVSIRVADLDGKPDPERIRAGLDTAKELRCDVISCSFVLENASASLLAGFRRVIEDGIVVVAASGNRAGVSNDFPEQATGVIVVGALDGDGRPLDDQRLGAFTDVFAPGDELDHIDASGDHSTNFGHTSGATALVSGLVALTLSTRPASARRAMAASMANIIRSTASRVGTFGNTNAGEINGSAMLTAL